MKGHHNKASSQEFSVDLACYSSQIRLGFRHRWDEHLRLLVRPCQFQPRLIQSPTRSSFPILVVNLNYSIGSSLFRGAWVTMPGSETSSL